MRNTPTMTLYAFALAACTASCGDDDVQNEMEATVVEEAMRPAAVDTVTAALLSNELVQATLSEWSVSLQPTEMPSGQVTFRVINNGQVMHDFEVEGEYGEAEVEGDVPPGEERTLTVTLQPGTYEIYCSMDTEHGKHRELGMRTAFIVR